MFQRISDPTLRRRLFDLVKAIAERLFPALDGAPVRRHIAGHERAGTGRAAAPSLRPPPRPRAASRTSVRLHRDAGCRALRVALPREGIARSAALCSPRRWRRSGSSSASAAASIWRRRPRRIPRSACSAPRCSRTAWPSFCARWSGARSPISASSSTTAGCCSRRCPTVASRACSSSFPIPGPRSGTRSAASFRAATLDALARVMADGAELRLATDDMDYARAMLARATAHRDFRWLRASAPRLARAPADWPPTRYEQKALAPAAQAALSALCPLGAARHDGRCLSTLRAPPERLYCGKPHRLGIAGQQQGVGHRPTLCFRRHAA